MTQELQDVNTHLGISADIFRNSLQKTAKSED